MSEATRYRSFLSSLDDDGLVSHIQDLSQELIRAESTPLAKAHSFQSTSSDPFDDGLDDLLLNLNTTHEVKKVEDLRRDDGKSQDQQRVLERPNNEKGTSPTPFTKKLVSDDLTADTSLESTESDSSSEGEVVGELHKFGDYGTYFHNKTKKQEKQDVEYVKWERQRRGQDVPLVFKGCLIHVNGHTVPSINEIHRMVILHGGNFVNYLNKKSAATHIVCNRLTPRKMKEFKNYKVVKAQWIVDCIRKKQLLDWKEYRLISEIDPDQKRLDVGWHVDRKLDATDPLVDNIAENDSMTDAVNSADYNENMRQVYAEEDKRTNLNSELINNGDDSITNVVNVNNNDAEDTKELDDLESDDVQKDNENNLELDDDFDITPLLTQPEEEDAPEIHEVHDVKLTKNVLNANHVDFLPHFFANSRLHHLSTWKADLRLTFLRRIVKENKPIVKHTNGRRIILHVDFDCFFATASCLNHPEYDMKTQPIAVSHGGKTSDVASCNYVARKYGVKNGMWVRRAKSLCPNLILLDYDFDAYEKYSNELYDYLIELKIFDSIYPVLIDEVLLDATTYVNDQIESETEVVKSLITSMRSEVFERTRCPVSVGIANNVLLAKLSLKKAKPNGWFHLQGNPKEFVSKHKVRDLPGIGHSVKEKFLTEIADANMEEPMVEDLLRFSKNKLISIFGSKTGLKLYQYARGIDDTSINIDTSDPVSILGRKTVSVDVNYGIRFDTVAQVDDFLMRLAAELTKRLEALGMCGSMLLFKLARRAKGAPIEPPKHLGMGQCDFVNKSLRLGIPTDDAGIIGSEVKSLYRIIAIPPKELRGIAISMSKLEDASILKKDKQMKLPFMKIQDMRETKSVSGEKYNVREDDAQRKNTHSSNQDNARLQSRRPLERPSDLPPDIDWEVFQQLPHDIRREILAELRTRNLDRVRPVKDRQVLPVKGKPAQSARSTTSLPTKNKSYLQQLLPTQIGSEPKFKRVFEAPRARSTSHSPSKKQRVISPTKPMVEYNESYDSQVVNELPSFIREEVKKDIKYKKLVKKLDLVLLRDKITKREQENQAEVSEVTMEWVLAQPRLNSTPLFMGGSWAELKKNIKSWVEESLRQKGPHEDDIATFVKYLLELLLQNNLNQCLILVDQIKKELEFHKSLLAMTSQRDSSNLEIVSPVGNPSEESVTSSLEFVTDGIRDWYGHLNATIYPLVDGYCRQHGKKVHTYE